MRKLGWYAVSAVVAAIILGGVLLLAANLYVQSMRVQAQIRQALAAALKMPVEIKKTTLTPWEGLRIDGITMRPEGSAENFLTADSFRVRLALLPLFHKQMVVEQVLLDHPELAWAQSQDGRWQFPPSDTPARHAAPEPVVPPEAPVPPDIAPAPGVPAPPVPESPAPPPVVAAAPPSPEAPLPHEPKIRKSRISIDVDKLKMRHGVLNFLDVRRHPIGRFEDVNVDTKVSGNDRANGALWFDRAFLLRAGLILTDFHSRFNYEDGALDLHDGNGRLASGTIRLNYHAAFQEPGSPFTAAVHVENVSLDELIAQAGGRPKLAEGRLRGDVKVWKLTGEEQKATGQIELVDSRFSNLPLLQTIGDALQIEDIRHLEFKKAQLDCTLEGTVLYIQPLVLMSNNLQISAQGNYRLDEDRLALRARLTIDRAVGRQLPQFIESNFLPCGDEAPGSRYMDFDITGSLSKPKSDLFAKVLQGSANNLLENLFAPKKKHEKKAPKHDQNSRPPADQDDGAKPGT